MSTNLRSLLDTLASDPGDSGARLQWFGTLTARLVAALAPFCDEPTAILPAQRALLVLAGRAARPPSDLSALSRALRQIDERLGRDGGGFSRLLDAALSAGESLDVERERADDVEPRLKPLASELERTGRELLAIDDLSHALGRSSELPAGAVVLEAAIDLATARDELSEDDAAALADAWIAQRGLDPALARLLGARAAIEHVTRAHLDLARDGAPADALALWVLAHRVVDGAGVERAPDRDELDELLAIAKLVPLEVFDAASLWRDLES